MITSFGVMKTTLKSSTSASWFGRLRPEPITAASAAK
jgi:hypothetical protein